MPNNGQVSSSNNASQRATTAKTAYKLEGGLLITEVPPPPEELDEEGTRWWNYYCTILVEGRCLSRMFVTALTNLCIMHMLRSCLMHDLAIQGVMIDIAAVDRNGQLTVKSVMNPLANDLQGCLIKMDKLLVSMGMTAFSSKVNNFDSKGMFTKDTKEATKGPPPMTLPAGKPIIDDASPLL